MTVFAIAVFATAYVLIASEKVHRVTVALTGAALMLAAGVLDFEHAFHEPEWAGSDVELSTTPVDAVHGDAVPVSKPALPSFWPEHPPPPPPPIVQVNDVDPNAPVVSVALTVGV